MTNIQRSAPGGNFFETRFVGWPKTSREAFGVFDNFDTDHASLLAVNHFDSLSLATRIVVLAEAGVAYDLTGHRFREHTTGKGKEITDKLYSTESGLIIAEREWLLPTEEAIVVSALTLMTKQGFDESYNPRTAGAI